MAGGGRRADLNSSVPMHPALSSHIYDWASPLIMGLLTESPRWRIWFSASSPHFRKQCRVLQSWLWLRPAGHRVVGGTVQAQRPRACPGALPVPTARGPSMLASFHTGLFLQLIPTLSCSRDPRSLPTFLCLHPFITAGTPRPRSPCPAVPVGGMSGADRG